MRFYLGLILLGLVSCRAVRANKVKDTLGSPNLSQMLYADYVPYTLEQATSFVQRRIDVNERQEEEEKALEKLRAKIDAEIKAGTLTVPDGQNRSEFIEDEAAERFAKPEVQDKIEAKLKKKLAERTQALNTYWYMTIGEIEEHLIKGKEFEPEEERDHPYWEYNGKMLRVKEKGGNEQALYDQDSHAHQQGRRTYAKYLLTKYAGIPVVMPMVQYVEKYPDTNDIATRWLWLEEMLAVEEHPDEALSDNQKWIEQQNLAHVLDDITGGSDRHSGNIRVRPNYSILLVDEDWDFTPCFPPAYRTDFYPDGGDDPAEQSAKPLPQTIQTLAKLNLEHVARAGSEAGLKRINVIGTMMALWIFRMQTGLEPLVNDLSGQDLRLNSVEIWDKSKIMRDKIWTLLKSYGYDTSPLWASERTHQCKLQNEDHYDGDPFRVLTYLLPGKLDQSPAFLNWDENEPNKTGDCLKIVKGGKWRDEACEKSLHVLCRRYRFVEGSDWLLSNRKVQWKDIVKPEVCPKYYVATFPLDANGGEIAEIDRTLSGSGTAEAWINLKANKQGAYKSQLSDWVTNDFPSGN
jgi:hypothetical protein